MTKQAHSLEEAFALAEEVGLWKEYTLHKFSGDGSSGVVYCIGSFRDRPIAEHESLLEAIMQAVRYMQGKAKQ